jgi:hypothetical protein
VRPVGLCQTYKVVDTRNSYTVAILQLHNAGPKIMYCTRISKTAGRSFV